MTWNSYLCSVCRRVVHGSVEEIDFLDGKCVDCWANDERLAMILDSMVAHRCELRHLWYVSMVYEWGGYFYPSAKLEDFAAACPRCGRPPVEVG